MSSNNVAVNHKPHPKHSTPPKQNGNSLAPPMFRFMPLAPEAEKAQLQQEPQRLQQLKSNIPVGHVIPNTANSFPSTSSATIMKQQISTHRFPSTSSNPSNNVLQTPMTGKRLHTTNHLNGNIVSPSPSMSLSSSTISSMTTDRFSMSPRDSQPDEKKARMSFPKIIRERMKGAGLIDPEEEGKHGTQPIITEIPTQANETGETIRLSVVSCSEEDGGQKSPQQIELPPNCKLFQISHRHEGTLRTFVVPMPIGSTIKDVEESLPIEFPQLANSVLKAERNFIASVDAAEVADLPSSSHAVIGSVKVSVPEEDMIEQPYLVNPKQYNRIMRRREMRKKLEEEGRLPKARQKYLHESRRKHALCRVRGDDGRFDCKKPADNLEQNDMEPMQYPMETQDNMREVPIENNITSYVDIRPAPQQMTRTLQAVPIGPATFHIDNTNGKTQNMNENQQMFSSNINDKAHTIALL